MVVRGLLVALLMGLAPLAAAGAESEIPTESADLVAFLGAPTRPERAESAWRALRDGEPELAVRLAAALGQTGGTGALETLGRLVRDRDDRVRVAALRAVGRVGLRNRDLMKRLREAVQWRTGQERRAAILALSHVGDGRDVDRLLELALEEDEVVSLTAYRALVRLTDKYLPPVHARWTYWWRSARHRAENEIAGSMRALEEEPTSPLAAAQREQLLAAAWVSVPEVEDRVEVWLRSSDEDLRLHALRIVVELGFSDLGDQIERVRRFVRDDEPLAIAADQALRKLGLLLPPPGDPPAPTEAATPVHAADAQVAGDTARQQTVRPPDDPVPAKGNPTAAGPQPVLPLLILLYATGKLIDPNATPGTSK